MPRRPDRRDVYADDFRRLCEALAGEVHPFRPDLVVGIQTGGAYVAEAMLARLGHPAYVAVRAQRPATRVKEKVRLGALVARLPRGVADILRWVEVEFRERGLRRTPAEDAVIDFSAAQADELRAAAAPARRILVVDDTIDSGRTLSGVTRAVRATAPEAEVRTAVLASTWSNPPVRADHCLFDRTLLRLPWSLDATPPA